MHNTDALMRQILALPLERIAEVEDFVAFITAREADRTLVRSSMMASNPAFDSVWNNRDDAAYDEL